MLVESNYKYLGESQRDRTDRLAVADPRRREELRGELGKLAYAECSFQPQLHARPMRVDRDAHDRLHRTMTVAASRLEHAPQLDDECTFAPKVASSYVLQGQKRDVKAHYDFSDPKLGKRIVDEVVEQRTKRAERARTRDERDLEHCTFRPSTGEAPVATSGPVVVRGLGRFLELKDLARKQREGREKPAPVHTGHVTVPEPFHLSTAARHLRRDRPPEPSFHPTTVESERREQVAKILDSWGLQDLQD